MALKADRRMGGPFAALRAGWADRRASGLLLVQVLSVLWATTGAAQEPGRRPWPADVARYAKWPALIATGTMLTLGFVAQRDAARWADSLAGTNPRAAQEHQSASARARGWILGGEIALVGTGAMFLIDLIHGDKGPPNVPFTPFTVYATPGRIGVSLRRR